jgi:hypothetical protein
MSNNVMGIVEKIMAKGIFMVMMNDLHVMCSGSVPLNISADRLFMLVVG